MSSLTDLQTVVGVDVASDAGRGGEQVVLIHVVEAAQYSSTPTAKIFESQLPGPSGPPPLEIGLDIAHA